MKTAKYEIDMCNGSIMDKLISFSLPLMISSILQLMFNAVDIIVVGRYTGSQALAAVGSTTALINIFTNLFIGISLGANVLAARYFAVGQDKEMSEAVHTAITLALVSGIIMAFAGAGASRFALELMDTPADVIDLSVIYMRIYFLGTIGNLIYNMGAAILRAVGDSRRPLYFLIASCMTNIVLDLLFVVVFHMNVAGAAIATIISQYLSATLVIRQLLKTSDSYKLDVKALKIDPMILRKVVKIGLPAGLQSMMYSISNVLIQANINSFGTDTIAAWAVFGKIDGLFWMTMDAMGIAITTFAGQNFGADKLDRVKRGNYVGLLMSAILTAILGGVVTILGPILSGLFTSDATVLEYSLNIIHFLVPFWFTYVCVNVFPSTLRGVGDALVPMLLVCIGTCVLRVTWIFTVGTFVHDLMVTLVSYPLSWSVTSIAFLIYYYRFSAIHKLTKLQKRSAK